MAAPLEDIKVIDMSRILAGPLAGQILADLGAEVTKIESPKGDDTRTWGPPFIEREGDNSASYFHSVNRGKSAICIDFNNADDLETLVQLIQSADVLIENYKSGGLNALRPIDQGF